jgi:hypothetical protein
MTSTRTRRLTDHIVEGGLANHQLTIVVLDEPGVGGVNHLYQIGGFDSSSNPSWDSRHTFPATYAAILFQNGPIKEAGVNGVTQEALLAIVIDRLECFQAGPLACPSNQMALEHCSAALSHLQQRTRERSGEVIK